MKKKIDYNSNVNQSIKGRLVEREVKACFSYEMESVLRASAEGQSNKEYPLPTYEDIENLYDYRCPQCGEPVEEVVSDDTRSNGGQVFNCTSCDYTAPDTDLCDQEPQEIFEWWVVSKWLYNKLKERNEPVLEWGNNCYWGRTCTGQAILLDGVISEIAEEMEILDGQKYSWA